MMKLTLLLLLSASVTTQPTVDQRVNVNLKEIFGTPDNPLIGDKVTTESSGSSSTASSASTVNIDEKIKKIFGGDPGSDTNLQPNLVSPSRTDCTRDDGKAGVCAVYYQCDPNTKKLITDGETLIDVRIGACPHYLDVCCLEHDINTTAPVSPTSPPDVTPRPCGYSNFGDEESYRISSGGTLAEFLEYPWMIALLKRTDAGAAWSQKEYLGGGSLIHPSVVLTAAHKIHGLSSSDIKCRAGEWDTQTTSEVYPFQERNVKKIVRHKYYYKPSVLNSIAVVILEEPFTPAPNIGVACIGKNMPPPSTKCWGMGWGKDKFFSEDSYATILKKVQLPLLSRKDCQTALRRTRLGSYFELHSSLTCAGGEEGRDTCGGDGGSPLVCPIGPDEDLRYAVFGMVAYGIGCGDKGVPGVYVSVPEFYSWLAETMKAEGFSTDSYSY